MAIWSTTLASDAINEDRLDADYFKPDDQAHLARMLKIGGKPLGNIRPLRVMNGRTPSNYSDDGRVPVVRSGDLVNTLIFPGNGQHYLRTAPDPSNVALQKGDVLISSIGMGSIGKIAIVTESANFVTVSEVTILRACPFSPEFLFSYLSTPQGQAQIERQITGATGQQHLLKSKVEKVVIPEPPSKIEELIRETVIEAALLSARAKNEYDNAERTLNTALALNHIDLTPRLFYEARFADASNAARMDAEYFQQAKRDIISALSRLQGQSIGEQFRPVRLLWKHDQAKPTDRVRNYDLTDALSPFLEDTIEPTTADQIGSTKKIIAPGDLVVSRLRSYLKEIAIVLPGGDTPLVGSSEFIVLRSNRKALSVETLLVYLRSPYVQTILKWCQDGSNHPRFDEKELLAIPIPDKIVKIQEQLTAKVKDAIAARRESRRMLDYAKRAVEIAIEENEAAALQFLKEARG